MTQAPLSRLELIIHKSKLLDYGLFSARFSPSSPDSDAALLAQTIDDAAVHL